MLARCVQTGHEQPSDPGRRRHWLHRRLRQRTRRDQRSVSVSISMLCPSTKHVADHRPASEGWASAAPSVMHACGHDGHIAIGLGVARVLQPFLADAAGKLLILFQPAEEGGRGARAVVEAGWMADVDLFLAIHIGLGVPSGSLALDVDGFLATRKFTVQFSGTGRTCREITGTGPKRSARRMSGRPRSAQPRSVERTRHSGQCGNIACRQDPERRAGRSGSGIRNPRRRNACAAIARHAMPANDRGQRGRLRSHDQHRTSRRSLELAQPIENCRLGQIGKQTNCALFQTSWTPTSFGASEDATLLASAVADRGGIAGIFVLGSDITDGHHTPHFDFDETVLARGTLLLSGLIAATMRVG